MRFKVQDRQSQDMQSMGRGGMEKRKIGKLAPLGLLEPLFLSSILMMWKQALGPMLGRKPWDPVEAFGYL